MRYTIAVAGLTVVLVLAIALLTAPRVVESVPAPTSRMIQAAERQQQRGIYVEDYQFTADEVRSDPSPAATRPTTSQTVHQ